MIGEVVADLAMTGSTRHDISLFALDQGRWSAKDVGPENACDARDDSAVLLDLSASEKMQSRL